MDKHPADEQMDKVEQYLDRVCRGIAGPRAMRQHIRQELREHLKDAIAEHIAAGMSEDQATDRALDDFGGPDIVRAELEATHGHRVMGVIIDKALQWQERTVKAKSFWSAWAHVALALVIGGEVTMLCLAVIFILPNFEWLVRYAGLEPSDEGFRPLFSWLLDVFRFFYDYGIWIIPAVIVLWGLWEWRIHSDRKPFIRLATMGTLAAALLVLIFLTAAVLIVPLSEGMRYVALRPPQPQVKQTMASLDQAIAQLQRDIRAKNTDQIRWDTYSVDGDLGDLGFYGSSLPGLLAIRNPAAMDELTQRIQALHDTVTTIRAAASNNDDEQLHTAASQLQSVYEPLKLSPTTRPAM